MVRARSVRIFTQIKVMMLLYTILSREIAIGILYWVVFFILFFLRKIPPFITIWKYMMIFFAVLIGTVWYNNWKKNNK